MVAFDALGRHAEIRGGANHHFFELCDVPAMSRRCSVKIQYRIADDLAGAVIGDVAAAVGGMKFHVHLLRAVRRLRADARACRCGPG